MATPIPDRKALVANGIFTNAQHTVPVPEINLPLTQSYHPTSFAERGVAIPVTTPALLGARMRPAQRTGTEFIIPNPSGGRGVYILDWGGVRQFCRPTVHDTMLHQRVGHLPMMTPAGVRQVAREIAAEGLAGRDARRAAEAAAQADSKRVLLANFLLLMTLVEQVEPTGMVVEETMQRTPELELRARQALRQVSPRISVDPTTVAANLEILAGLFARGGLAPWGPSPRLIRLLARMRQLRDRLIKETGPTLEGSRGGLAGSLITSIATFIRCAESLIAKAHGRLSDVVGLLGAWHANPGDIQLTITRPDWLLDGWDQICLLAEDGADVHDSHAIVREVTQLVPLLPKEAMDWLGDGLTQDALEPSQRATEQGMFRRQGGASFGLVARNEKLRAMGV